jgi:hypothetical protein
VNTFTPLDFDNLTGGVFNAQTLLDGNSLASIDAKQFGNYPGYGLQL